MTLETSIAIETIWAARLVTEPHRNTERRAEWEAAKDLWRLWPAPRPSKPLTAAELGRIADMQNCAGAYGSGSTAQAVASNILYGSWP